MAAAARDTQDEVSVRRTALPEYALQALQRRVVRLELSAWFAPRQADV